MDHGRFFERGYVDDAGFILDYTALVGGAAASPLDAEHVPPGTEDGFMGAHIVPQECPAADPADTDVRDGNAESGPDEAF